MSVHWNIYCAGCDNEPLFPGWGMNGAEEALADLLTAREEVAAAVMSLASVMSHRHGFEVCLRVLGWSFDPAYFVSHRSHTLVLRNEDGDERSVR